MFTLCKLHVWFTFTVGTIVVQGDIDPRAPCLGNTSLPILNNGGTNEQVVLVSSAVLVSTNASSACYRLIEVWCGKAPSNEVRVCFYPNTLSVGGCPTNAILVLKGEQGLPATWLMAVGGDASLGIRPYSLEKWNEIKHQNPEHLLQSRPEDRITKAKAMHIALNAVTQEGYPRDHESLQCNAVRYDFGWIVDVTLLLPDGRSIIGSDILIRVGDDGRIKTYNHGM